MSQSTNLTLAALANGQWTTNLHGYIANDPLNAGNHAVAFSGIQGGGDLWSVALTGGTYTLSFDVLGTCSNGTPGNCGAVGNFRLKMEDFNGRPNDVFFDNLCISSTAGDSSCPSNTRNETPEPGSLALAGLALAGLGFARRKGKAPR